jgi:hypothetical protein
MSQPFESVRDQLLRAGIAPRHVRRYIVELREHLADLTARERGAGLDVKAAGERARAMLGTDHQLVQAMIERAPRSLTARAPWAVFALLPVVMLVAVVATIAISMMHLLGPVHAAWPGGVPNSYTGPISAASFVADYLLGPVFAAGGIALALRQRLTSRWVWIGLGLIALFSGMFGFYMNVLPPRGGFPGGAVFSALPNVIVDGHVNAAATLALVALRAGVLFAVTGIAYGAMRTRSNSAAVAPAA